MSDLFQYLRGSTMNLRLLAHILNDRDLTGSHLQGTNFRETGAFIRTFLEQASNKTIPGVGVYTDILASECQKMLPLINLFLEHASADQQDVDLRAEQIVSHYNNHKRVFVPGGWRGKPGHAMIYEFKYDESTDQHVLLVWNTGSGLDYHLYEESENGTLYSPVKAYNFALTKNTEKDFKDYIIELLKPYLEIIDNFDSKDLYHTIISKISFLNGKEVNPTEYCSVKTRPQFSGTCAYRSLEKLIQNYGFSDIPFELVEYEIQRFAITQFISEITPEAYQDKAIWHQLTLAMRNFSHTLSDVIKNNLIHPEQQTLGFELIKSLSNKLKCEPLPSEVCHPVEDNKWPHTEEYYIWLDSNQTIENEAEPSQNRSPITRIATFDILKDLSSKAVATPIDADNLVNEIIYIESILLNIPLETRFWERLRKPKKALFELTDHLLELVIKYCKACKMKDGFSYPERVIAVYSAIVAAERIANIIYDNNQNIVRNLNYSFIKSYFDIQDTAFFVICTEQLTARKKQIDDYYRDKKSVSSTSSEITFITHIANRDKFLKEDSKSLNQDLHPCLPKNRAALFLFSNRDNNNYQNCILELECAFKISHIIAFGNVIARQNLNTLLENSRLRYWDHNVRIEHVSNENRVYLDFGIYISSYGNEDSHTLEKSLNISPITVKDLKRRDPNSIQTKLKPSYLSQELCQRRQIAHCRSQSKTQVVATIEYIKSHLSELKGAPNTLKILFAILFQNGLISEEIRNNPGAINSLVDCIEKGITFYQAENSPWAVQTQFFQMAVFLNNYLLSTKDNAYKNRFEAIIKKLNDRINAIAALEDINDNQISTHDTLTCLYAINCNASMQDNSLQLSSDEWEILSENLSYIGINGIDPFILYHAERAQDNLNRYFYKSKIPILNTSGLPDRILKDGFFQRYFQSSQIHFDSANSHSSNNIYYLADPYEDHRVIYYDHEVFIQKNIGSQDSPDWIQLVKSNNFNDFKMLLPHTLGDSTKVWWQTNNIDAVIEERNDPEKAYRFIFKRDHTYEIQKYIKGSYTYRLINLIDNPGLPRNIYFIKNLQSSIRNHLTLTINTPPTNDLNNYADILKCRSFEHVRFIELWENIYTNETQLCFPRYGLIFRSKAEAPNEFYWDAHPEYTLSFDTRSPISNFKGYLALNKKSDDGTISTYYIIPKQVFDPSKTEEADFMHFSMDNNNKKNEKNISHENIPNRMTLANSEKYILCEKQKNELLIPSELEDKIYLMYLYFIQREPSKALNIAKQCLSSKLETLSSVKYIEEIIATKSIDGPDFVSICTLVYVYLVPFFTKCHQNTTYSNDKELEAYFDEDSKKNMLLSSLKNQLSKYITLQKYIPKHLRLDETILISLINAYKTVRTSLPFDVSIFAKKSHLRRLEKEHQTLTSLLNSNLISKKQKLRLDHISTKQNKLYSFTPVHTILEQKTLEISIDSLNLCQNDYLKECNAVDKLSIDDLSMTTDLAKLAPNVISLFQEAMADTSRREALETWVTAMLNAMVGDLYSKSRKRTKPLIVLKTMLDNSSQINSTNKRTCMNILQNLQCRISTVVHSEADALTPKPILKLSLLTQEQVNLRSTAISVIAKNVTTRDILKELGLLNFLVNSPASSESSSSSGIYTSNKTERFQAILTSEANQDYRRGSSQNYERKLNELRLCQMLESSETRTLIKQKLSDALDLSRITCTKLETKIVKLINSGLKHNQNKRKDLSIYSEKREVLTISQAITYFSNFDPMQFAKDRYLSEQDVENFKIAMMDFLLASTNQQQLERSLNLLDDIDEAFEINHDKHFIDALFVQLGLNLIQERFYNPNQYPELLLFEYLDNKLLYKEQIDVLSSLMMLDSKARYQSKSIQLMPGGGKTKVLLVNLVKLRANGTNLVVVEVPPQLHYTNFRDLETTSNKVFSQKAHSFEFNRNMESNAATFKSILKTFKHIISNKEYLVTTRQSVDSLWLKYIEILSFNRVGDLEWENQVSALSKIFNIFKSQGDVIIDEIHWVLDSKDQLIYNLGNGIPLDPSILNALIRLYLFTKSIKQGDTTLFDFLVGAAPKPSAAICTELMKQFARNVALSSESPLSDILSDIADNDRNDLIYYFSDASGEMPDFINRLPPVYQEIVSVYKIELTQLLFLSLMKNLNEHWGLSQCLQKDPLEREVAIPFAGSNNPQEWSRFQNILLTQNYTVQVQFGKPLSEYLFNQFILSFKKSQDAERIENMHKAHPVKLINDQYNAIFGNSGIALDDIDISNSSLINQLYDQFKNDIHVKVQCLKQYVLPSILNTPLSLIANTQNHTNHYRSRVGFTGTDYNRRTFDLSIIYDEVTSDCSNGKVTDFLIQKQNVRFHKFGSEEFAEIFTFLNSYTPEDKLRAIIDAGAHFRGVPNRVVANSLSSWLAISDPVVMYVLYFDNNDILCALPTDINSAQSQPIMIGGSDNLHKRLGCKPIECFTYFDQVHTTGVDIKQDPNARAILTVGRTPLYAFIQAAMRFRGLAQLQHIDIALLIAFLEAYPSYKTNPIELIELFNILLNIQCDALMDTLHPTSVNHMIANVFVKDVSKQIQAVELPSHKAIIVKAFYSFLFDDDKRTFFEKYAHPAREVDTDIVLSNLAKGLMQEFNRCLNLRDVSLESIPRFHSEEKLMLKVNSIIQHALNICKSKQLSPLSNHENHMVTQKQIQSQHQTETEKQTETTNVAVYSPHDWPLMFGKTFPLNFKQRFNTRLLFSLHKFCSLESVIKRKHIADQWVFSDSLWLSFNYSRTCHPFTNTVLDPYKKPIYFIFGFYNAGNLNYIIITQTDAEALRNNWYTKPESYPDNCWVETSGGVLYAGHRVTTERTQEELELLQQIYLFNADLSYLISYFESTQWLKEHTQAKLRFLEENILPFLPSKGTLLPHLKHLAEPFLMINESQNITDNVYVTDDAESALLSWIDSREFPDIFKDPIFQASSFEEAIEFHNLALLHYAISDGRTDIVNILLAHITNVNAIAKDGKTALYLAIEHGHLDILNALIAHGADVESVDSTGWSALDRAHFFRVHADIIETLLIHNTNKVAAEVTDLLQEPEPILIEESTPEPIEVPKPVLIEKSTPEPIEVPESEVTNIPETQTVHTPPIQGFFKRLLTGISNLFKRDRSEQSPKPILPTCSSKDLSFEEHIRDPKRQRTAHSNSDPGSYSSLNKLAHPRPLLISTPAPKRQQRADNDSDSEDAVPFVNPLNSPRQP